MGAPKTRTIRLPVFVHASPKKVFDAVTRPELLTRWFMHRASITPKWGGSYSFSWEGGPTHTGRIVDFVRGKRMTLTWQWPGLEKLGVTKMKLSVERKADGSILRFTHSGFLTGGPWTDLYEGAIRGWTYFMMNFKSVMETNHDLRSPYDW
jgi:uncharacterized protein YndB with AHSA1/START domain